MTFEEWKSGFPPMYLKDALFVSLMKDTWRASRLQAYRECAQLVCPYCAVNHMNRYVNPLVGAGEYMAHETNHGPEKCSCEHIHRAIAEMEK